jgi:tRNA dimethylallyltransferase
MLEAGLVEEARVLHARGLSRTARQALGYRQVIDASDANLAEEITRATKRFARRQESWFKADPRVVWFDASDPNVVDRLGDYFTHNLGQSRTPTLPHQGAR